MQCHSQSHVARTRSEQYSGDQPGGRFGKTWLIEIGGCYTPLFLIVEADSVQDAIEELADNESGDTTSSSLTRIWPDYPEEDRHYGPSGQVLDLDHLMVTAKRASHVRFLAATTVTIYQRKARLQPITTPETTISDTLQHIGGSNDHSSTGAGNGRLPDEFAEDHINGGYGDILDRLNAEDRFSEEYPDLDEPWDTIVAHRNWRISSRRIDEYFGYFGSDEDW